MVGHRHYLVFRDFCIELLFVHNKIKFIILQFISLTLLVQVGLGDENWPPAPHVAVSLPFMAYPSLQTYLTVPWYSTNFSGKVGLGIRPLTKGLGTLHLISVNLKCYLRF